jgi:hypothetical protein
VVSLLIQFPKEYISYEKRPIGGDNIKTDIQEMILEEGLDRAGLGYKYVAGTCET